MVSILTRIFGTAHLQTAEDVVQDTLIQALQVWKIKGIPENPSGWIMAVARNKAIDVIRRQRHSVNFDFSDDRILLNSEYTLETTMDDLWKEEAIKDDMLRMMYACCHPGLSAENQITLVLKTLCGFSAGEIAAAFLTTEDTVSKRLYRTKEYFRKEKIPMEIPPPDDLKERTGAVLNSIYLLFNEGYSSAQGEDRIRKDLIGEAMLLCRMLADNPLTSDPRAWALLALMCFHASRNESRLGPEGEIILLPSQDRSRWDFRLIEEGNECMDRAASGEVVSPYHLEAAIAFEHCTAESFEAVNWKRILGYYEWLARIAPSPMIELNRIIVVMQVHGAAVAQAQLETLPEAGRFTAYSLYHALRGEILLRMDYKPGARGAFEEAARLTQSVAERRVLEEKIAALAD